jgi:uncharacterized protein YggU (UPF0235/DUF167 family)
MSGKGPQAMLRLRVKPGARESGVVREGGEVILRVRERAVDGAANAACIRSVANALGVAVSRVTVTRGHRARAKTLAISGIEQEELDEAFARILRER